MKKNKVRRKAINCELVRPSKSNPGYFKYLVTIQEPNGDIIEQPAYGIDMQDAVSRLVWVERTEKVAKVADKPKILNILALVTVAFLLIPSALSIYFNNPYPIVMTIMLYLSAFGGAIVFRNHLNKK